MGPADAVLRVQQEQPVLDGAEDVLGLALRVGQQSGLAPAGDDEVGKRGAEHERDRQRGEHQQSQVAGQAGALGFERRGDAAGRLDQHGRLLARRGDRDGDLLRQLAAGGVQPRARALAVAVRHALEARHGLDGLAIGRPRDVEPRHFAAQFRRALDGARRVRVERAGAGRRGVEPRDERVEVGEALADLGERFVDVAEALEAVAHRGQAGGEHVGLAALLADQPQRRRGVVEAPCQLEARQQHRDREHREQRADRERPTLHAEPGGKTVHRFGLRSELAGLAAASASRKASAVGTRSGGRFASRRSSRGW